MALPKRKRQNKNEVDLNQPDEFISVAQRLFGWAAENRKPLIVASGIAIAGVVLFSGGREVVARKSATRANAFAKAVDIQSTPVKPPAAEGDDAVPAPDPAAPLGTPQPPKDDGPTFETSAARAESALAEFGKVDGGAVADLALLGQATALLDLGKTEAAVASYTKFLESGVGEAYRFFGHDGLATALAHKGDNDGALAAVAKIASLDGGKYADHAAFRTGRLLEGKGDTAGAIKAYKELLEKHPESGFKPQAEKRLGLLGG